MIWLNSTIDRISFNIATERREKMKIKIKPRERNEFEIKCGHNGKLRTLAIDIFLPIEIFFIQRKYGKRWKIIRPQKRSVSKIFPLFMAHYYHFRNFMFFGNAKSEARHDRRLNKQKLQFASFSTTGFACICSRVALSLMWIKFRRLILAKMKMKQQEKKGENDSAWQF